jgi:hypothetical protein
MEEICPICGSFNPVFGNEPEAVEEDDALEEEDL